MRIKIWSNLGSNPKDESLGFNNLRIATCFKTKGHCLTNEEHNKDTVVDLFGEGLLDTTGWHTNYHSGIRNA